MDSANISRYSSNSSGYTEYSINVSYLGQGWKTKKRFSDFKTLDDALKANGIVVVGAALPEKNWFSKFDVDFLVKRAKALQNYLDKMILVTPCPSLIKEFLEVEKNMLVNNLKKNRSMRAIKKTDKIAAIVNKAKSKFIVLNTNERFALMLKAAFQDRFPSGGLSSKGSFKRGTASSFNSESSFRKESKVPGESKASTPKGSFSTMVEDTGHFASHQSGSRNQASSILLALQTAEYRSAVEKRIMDCFSRRSYLLSFQQYEQLKAMTLYFPDNGSDIISILSAPITSDYSSGELLADSLAVAVDGATGENVFLLSADADLSLDGTELLADRMVFSDPPPPSPTRKARNLPRNPSEVDGPGLLIRRTTQDSGSNRPPGSHRPAPCEKV